MPRAVVRGCCLGSSRACGGVTPGRGLCGPEEGRPGETAAAELEAGSLQPPEQSWGSGGPSGLLMVPPREEHPRGCCPGWEHSQSPHKQSDGLTEVAKCRTGITTQAGGRGHCLYRCGLWSGTRPSEALPCVSPASRTESLRDVVRALQERLHRRILSGLK